MKCKFCPFTSDNHDELVSHYVKKHRDEEEFVIKCSVCMIEYTSVASLRSHFIRKHKERCTTQRRPGTHARLCEQPDPEPHSENDSDGSSSDHTEEREPDVAIPHMVSFDQPSDEELEDGETEWDESAHSSSESESDELNMEANEEAVPNFSPKEWEEAKFLLYLREEGMISDTAIGKTIHGMENLFHTYSETIKERVQEHLRKTSVGLSAETFQEIFEHKLFASTNTKKKLDSFSKKFCNVLLTDKVVISTEEVTTKTGLIKTVSNCAYVCPLLPALERLLNQPDVLECVDEPFPVSTDTIIRSYRDGNYCRTHKILSQDGTLGIILVFDELEISSPLGPKKHKLALYYWALVNLHNHLKSSIRSINLYAIAMSKHLKVKKPLKDCPSLDMKYEAHVKIMASFLSDIRKLENGVDMIINGEKTTFKGALYCVSGDSPATNVFAGSKESVGKAHKPCHTCVTTHEEMQVIFNEDSFPKRTLESLNADRLTIAQGLLVKERVENSTICGLNGPSVIGDLQYFDHSKCFVFDLMHVLHEGVLEAHMRCFLNFLVSKGHFTIEAINASVNLVASQFLHKDKPASIKKEHLLTGLRQSAGQMLSLALCLPFAIMEKADKLGFRYINFIKLVKISMGLLSHELATEDLVVLKREIRLHNELFTQHYPSFEITPKWHYLIHMVSQILNFGPARVTWTMRFEAMHSYFKNLMRIMKNFINPPKSCSYRYQCLRASQMLKRPGEKPKPFLQTDDVISVSQTVLLKTCEYRSLLVNLFGNEKISLNLCTILKTNGVEFRIGTAVILDKEGMKFALIKEIVVYQDIKVLLCNELKTEHVEACNGYKILECDTQNIKASFVENIAFFQPMPVVKVKGFSYILAKYHRLGAKFS